MGRFTNRKNSMKTIFLANNIATPPTNAAYDALSPGYSRMELRRTFGSLKRAYSVGLIAARNADVAPVVAIPLVDQTVVQAQALSYAFNSGSFTDAEGDTLTYTARLSSGAALPVWLTFTAGTRTFSGTAPAYVGSAADVTTVTVTATDIHGASITDTFTITVLNA